MPSLWIVVIVVVFFVLGGIALYFIVQRRLQTKHSSISPADPGDSRPYSEPASDPPNHHGDSGDCGTHSGFAIETVHFQASVLDAPSEDEKQGLIRLINLYRSRRVSWLRSAAYLGPALETLQSEADRLDVGSDEWSRLRARAETVFEILDALECEKHWAAVEAYIADKVGPISGAFRRELQAQTASAMESGRVDLAELRRQSQEIGEMLERKNEPVPKRRPSGGRSLPGAPF